MDSFFSSSKCLASEYRDLILLIIQEKNNKASWLIIPGRFYWMSLTRPRAIPERAGAWYTLDGRKLDTKPTQKGMYIHNGKKVVVK